NFHGVDSFVYRTNDGQADSNLATVTITVHSVNDAPVAAGATFESDGDTPRVVVAADGVLANDTDVDGDLLTATVVTGPANGRLTLNADGSFAYMADANFHGVDSFVYRANDGTADSNPATVTITVHSVNDAPVAAADSYETSEDLALLVSVAE